MEQNKEQLEALLKFIDQLGQNPDNAWFVERLKERYAETSKNQSKEDKCFITYSLDMDVFHTQVSNIEKYLSLDFKFDNNDSLKGYSSLIDYSGINDVEIRDELESDNREMLRYRYGTRSHKIDFYEFCKYAHFQAESLLNYIYEPVGDYTIEDCMEHIRYYYPDVKFFKNTTSTPTDITYYAKMLAFTEEFYHVDGKSKSGIPKRGKLYWTLYDIEEARNITNHRGKDNTLADNFKELLSKTPFDEVINAIKLLAEQVQSIDRTKFLAISQKWLNATITSILPSAAFIKTDTGEPIQLPPKFLKAVEGKKQGDVIQVKKEPNGQIKEIKS